MTSRINAFCAAAEFSLHTVRRYHYQTLSFGIIWDSPGTDKKRNVHFPVHCVCVRFRVGGKKGKLYGKV